MSDWNTVNSVGADSYVGFAGIVATIGRAVSDVQSKSTVDVYGCETSPMELFDGVYLIHNLLTPEECRASIASSEARGYEPAPISTAMGFQMRPDIRNNARVISDDVEQARALWQRVRDELPTFVRGRQAIGLNERFRFYRYDPGERFAPHRDGAYRRDNGEISLLTLLVYLNEGFEGGETIVEGRTITPREGMALIFDHQLMHEGAAVVRGRKYVLRSDVMFGRIGQIRG